MKDLIDALQHLKKLTRSGMYNLPDWSDGVKQLGEAYHAVEDDLAPDAKAAVTTAGSQAKYVCDTLDRSIEVRATAREQLAFDCGAALTALQ